MAEDLSRKPKPKQPPADAGLELPSRGTPPPPLGWPLVVGVCRGWGVQAACPAGVEAAIGASAAAQATRF